MTAIPSHPHAAMTHPHPSDPNSPDPGDPAEPEPENAPAHHPAASAEPAASRPRSAAGRLRAAAADNLMVAIFGPMIVLLLGYSLYTTNARFAAVNDRFTAVDARFLSLEADMDDRFDSLEAGQAEIARTLAVLVAVLNARTEVDAALDGRLLAPDAAVPAESHSGEP